MDIKTNSKIKYRNQLTIQEALKLKGDEFSEKVLFDVYYLTLNEHTICTNCIPLV